MQGTTAPPTLDVATFSHVVGHDLKAPLRAIHLFLGILEEDLDDRLGDEDRRRFQVVRDELVRMSALIDGVRAFAQVPVAGAPADHPSTVTVGPAAVHEAWGTLDAHDTHHLHVADDLPDLPLPPLHAATVLRVLLHNAVTHHGDGPATVHVTGGHGPDTTWIDVHDDGPGLPAPLEELLVPFRPGLDRSRPRIGLALANHVLAHHDGWIEDVSDGGGGAGVRVVVMGRALDRGG